MSSRSYIFALILVHSIDPRTWHWFSYMSLIGRQAYGGIANFDHNIEMLWHIDTLIVVSLILHDCPKNEM
jgi:hypothetical protein